MNELINKQSAIDAMCNACSDWCDEGVCKKVSAIQKLPSTQPEQEKGKWIEEPNCWYRCSKCGNHYPSIRRYMNYNYCPNCGSYNGGES